MEWGLQGQSLLTSGPRPKIPEMRGEESAQPQVHTRRTDVTPKPGILLASLFDYTHWTLNRSRCWTTNDLWEAHRDELCEVIELGEVHIEKLVMTLSEEQLIDQNVTDIVVEISEQETVETVL